MQSRGGYDASHQSDTYVCAVACWYLDTHSHIQADAHVYTERVANVHS